MLDPETGDVTVTIPADLAAKLSGAYEAWRAALDDVDASGVDTDPTHLAALWRARSRTELALADVYGELAYSVGPFVPLINAVFRGVDACRGAADRYVGIAERLEGRAS